MTDSTLNSQLDALLDAALADVETAIQNQREFIAEETALADKYAKQRAQMERNKRIDAEMNERIGSR